MTVILPVNRHFLHKADVNATSTNNGRMSDEQIAARLMSLLRENGEMSVREISDALGYRSPPSSLRKVIRILIAAEAIQYTHPESPNAPNQKLVIW